MEDNKGKPFADLICNLVEQIGANGHTLADAGELRLIEIVSAYNLLMMVKEWTDGAVKSLESHAKEAATCLLNPIQEDLSEEELRDRKMVAGHYEIMKYGDPIKKELELLRKRSTTREEE